MKTLLIAGMMVISTASFAQVHKCIDEKSGKVVGYGNDCPTGSRSEQLSIQKAPAAQGQKSLAERDADFRKRQMQKEEAEQKDAKKSAEAEQRRRNCEQSQAYLKSLEGGHRISRTDPKTGERAFLQDSDYAAEMAKTRASIAANCK